MRLGLGNWLADSDSELGRLRKTFDTFVQWNISDAFELYSLFSYG